MRGSFLLFTIAILFANAAVVTHVRADCKALETSASPHLGSTVIANPTIFLGVPPDDSRNGRHLIWAEDENGRELPTQSDWLDSQGDLSDYAVIRLKVNTENVAQFSLVVDGEYLAHPYHVLPPGSEQRATGSSCITSLRRVSRHLGCGDDNYVRVETQANASAYLLESQIELGTATQFVRSWALNPHEIWWRDSDDSTPHVLQSPRPVELGFGEFMCAPTNYPSTHLDRLTRIRLTAFYADGRMERGSWQAVKSVQQPDRASIDDLDFGAALMLERDHCPADFFDTQAQVAAVEPNAEAVAEAVASATTLTTTVASRVKCAEALPACLEFGGNAMTGMPNFLTRGWACGMFLLVGILVGIGLRRRSS